METRVDLKFLQNDQFEIVAATNQVTITVDKKKEGVPASGPNPLELFLSSLASCVGVYALRYLSSHTISFSTLSVRATADFSPEPPARLGNIKLAVLTDAALEDKKEVFLRFIRNCPIHNTVMHTSKVSIDLA
ncbi:MAG: OsmC family protein [Candidatus Omnitrophota bacterium]